MSAGTMILPSISHVSTHPVAVEEFARRHDLEYARHELDPLDGFVARSQGDIVGAVLTFAIEHPSLTHQVCRIVSLAIAPAHRGGDLEERLIRTMEDAHPAGTLVYGAFDRMHARPLEELGYRAGSAGAALKIPGVDVEITPTDTAPHMLSRTLS